MDHPVQTPPLTQAACGASHPLDPLSESEVARAMAIIRVHFSWGDDLRVETIDIEEPEKDFVRSYVQGTPFPRVVRFNVYRRGVMGVWQGSYGTEPVDSVHQIEGRADDRPVGTGGDESRVGHCATAQGC